MSEARNWQLARLVPGEGGVSRSGAILSRKELTGECAIACDTADVGDIDMGQVARREVLIQECDGED